MQPTPLHDFLTDLQHRIDLREGGLAFGDRPPEIGVLVMTILGSLVLVCALVWLGAGSKAVASSGLIGLFLAAPLGTFLGSQFRQRYEAALEKLRQQVHTLLLERGLLHHCAEDPGPAGI